MTFQRMKIIFGRIICIKSSPPCSNDVWTKSFIVGAWEVIWAIWTPARQKMEIGGLSFKKQLLGRIADIKSSVDDQTLSGSESLWVWFQPQVWFHS